MSEELFVQCCAPTLAGIKTGNMFSCEFEDEAAMDREVRGLEHRLEPYGLRILPLRYRNGKALLYVYRPSHLKKDMENAEARKILHEAGYQDLGCGACIDCLMRKLRDSDEFPHEIGLFLSYPPEDVRGFMENHAQNYKFVGYWKVYGDEEKARRTFSKYKKCTDFYCRRLREGSNLAELTVAV